jgi:transcriptional regulator
MYTRASFADPRPELAHKLMREHGFATVVTIADGTPCASHVPVLVTATRDGGAVEIRGHVARANPQWRQLAHGENVLAIFQGPHGYVSPSWYGEARNVPTWNYTVVHAYGRTRLLDAVELRAHVKDLVDVHERAFERPWRVESLPADFVDGLLGGIVGFEISVDRVETNFKLSQNRTADDQRRVRDQLAASADPTSRDLAAWMDLVQR